MLEIHELRLSAIGRFVDEQVIDFRKLGNLVQVDGLRTDTGGSSGSGKSTVFNSLDYLFGLNDLPSSVLQSRFTKDGISVTMIGKYCDKDLVITRGKGKLSVDLDGEITTGSKLAEEKIDQILGMPRKLFRPLLHKRQKEGGFFLQFTPKEIHEFLTDALGHSEIRKKQELVDKKLKAIEEGLLSSTSLHDQAKSALNATQDALLALGSPPEKQVDQATVLGLKKQYDTALEVLAPLKTRHVLEIQAQELKKPEIRSTTMDDTALKAAEAQVALIQAEERVAGDRFMAAQLEERQRAAGFAKQVQALKDRSVTMGYEIQTANAIKLEAAKLAVEVQKIRNSICPTCQQGWATEAAKAREAELLAKITSYKEIILKGAKSEQEIAQISAQIQELTPLITEQPLAKPTELTELEGRYRHHRDIISAERMRAMEYSKAQYELNKVVLEEFSQSLRALSDRHAAELAQVNGQIDITRRSFEGAAQQLKSYSDARARFDASKKTLSEQKIKYEVAVKVSSDSIAQLTEDQELAQDLKSAIKSYMSCSFDEALEYVGAAATEIIRAIPNMANATIQLEGVRETKDGKIKEEVNAVINMDGETAIPIKSLSGGERSAVDLAVDLAVVDLLENRSNKGVNLFILDEPFTGLDTVSIEMAIEKLRSLNKRLVIVDHNPEIKQMVESRLVVVRDGLTSKIIQN